MPLDTMMETMRHLTPSQIESLKELSPLKERALRMRLAWLETARPNQLPPEGSEWDNWLILAGRGFGKTRTGAEEVLDRALALPKRRVAVIGATTADTRKICYEGESGLIAIIPEDLMVNREWNKQLLQIKLINGSIITGFGAEKPERLRGPQFHYAWCDELASWKYPEETWDNLSFCLRLGETPQTIITTTPRPIKTLREIIKDPRTVIVRGSTFENKENLAPAYLRRMMEKYGGTRTGRQELYAEVLEDTPGALWNSRQFDNPVHVDLDNMYRIAVGVDPAISSKGEHGIIVAGSTPKPKERHFVLEDASLQGSPEQMARRAIAMYKKYQGDAIVIETNQGGDMLKSLFNNIDDKLPLRTVRASKGKFTRAEPIAALYEQGRVSHAGSFPQLEDQMCTYVPGERESPDRLDAMVWVMTWLTNSRAGGNIRTLGNMEQTSKWKKNA